MPSRFPLSPRHSLVPLGAFAALAALAACRKAPEDIADGDDPIAALKVTTESRRYDTQFWQAQRDSPDSARHRLYTQAVAYCGQKDVAIDGAKPNCRGVMAARALEHHGSAATGGMRF